MTNKYSDKAIRSKPLKDMSPAERALFELQSQQAAETIKAKYRNEPQMLLALAMQLREEAGRQLYREKPTAMAEPKEDRHSSENSLFGGND